ncbi:MAG: hypothetical protein WC180_07140 [Candidatus Paceibacterota bacterium]
MKTPEQATMEFITNHLAKEKEEEEWVNEYIERIRWYISNEVERLKKDNEWLTAKVGGRRLRNGPNN